MPAAAMLSRLHRRRPKDAEAGGNLGESSSSGNRESDNLGEYPALDRYISVYRDDTPLSGEETHEKRKTPWWKFWKFQDDEAVPHKPIPPGAGIPEDWLSTDISAGIRSSDVEERRKRTGYNELMAEKENPFVKFLSYFRGPILYGAWELLSFLFAPFSPPFFLRACAHIEVQTVMELAALLALGLSDWIDFGVIMGILMLNAFVGFYQEKQAADVVASLKGDIAMRCNVVRDGQKVNILARELVLGDIVSLHVLFFQIFRGFPLLTFCLLQNKRSLSRRATRSPPMPGSSATMIVPRTSKYTSGFSPRTSSVSW